MTAIRPRDIDAYVKKRDPQHAAILIYGNDAGSVRERSDLIARQIVSDLKDPFNFIELSDAELKEEPARLADEAAALSFMGGERVVRVRGTGGPVDSAAKLLVSGLDNDSIHPNGVTIIEAGALKKTAALRKLFEKSTRCAAIACYEDNDRDVGSLVTAMLAEEGLAIDNDALSLLTATLGTDRGITRSEIEKLIVFMGPKSLRTEDSTRSITTEDIAQCLADFTQDMAGDVAQIVAGGQKQALSAALFRAREAGTAAMTLLVFLQRHFGRLYTAQGMISGGQPPAVAMKKLRPPVFFAEERAFQDQLKRWPLARLEAALANLLQAEHEAKSTGAPAQEIIERVALRLSAMAGK